MEALRRILEALRRFVVVFFSLLGSLLQLLARRFLGQRSARFLPLLLGLGFLELCLDLVELCLGLLVLCLGFLVLCLGLLELCLGLLVLCLDLVELFPDVFPVVLFLSIEVIPFFS